MIVKAKRLIELIMYMNQKRTFTAQELANEFGVSKRTIFRDLQDLSELGVPLYAEWGPHGGYQLLRERILPPISFTEEETVAIFFAVHALRHYSSLPFKTELSSVIRKFFHYLPHDLQERVEKMKHRVDLITPTRHAVSLHLEILLDAAIEQTVIQITYRSHKKTTIRDIQPIGIYAHDGLWYCPAYCFLRSDFRVFRCDHIESAMVSPHKKAKDLSAVHLENRRQKLNLRKQKNIHCFIELSKEGLHRCEKEIWLSAYLHRRKDGTGWIEGDFSEKDIPFLSSFLIGLGKEVKVKHPPELVNAILKELTELIGKYQDE